GIALDRFNEIRNQVRAPLQLHLDLRLGGIHLFVVGLDRVVAAPAQHREQNGRQAKRPCRGVHERFLSKRFTYSAVRPIASRYASGSVSPSVANPISAPASRTTASGVAGAGAGRPAKRSTARSIVKN